MIHKDLPVENNVLRDILDKDIKCDRYSKFDTLLDYFDTYDFSSFNNSDKLSIAISMLQNYVIEHEGTSDKIKFLI